MRRFVNVITLFILLAITAFVASGEDSLPQYNGVVVSREATTVPNYSYLVFTNTNNFTVSLNYAIEGGPRGEMTLQSKESKRSYLACANDVKVDIKVKYTKEKCQHKKSTAKNNLIK